MRLMLVALAALLGLVAVEPPNPACLVPVPYHCDPPPQR